MKPAKRFDKSHYENRDLSDIARGIGLVLLPVLLLWPVVANWSTVLSWVPWPSRETTAISVSAKGPPLEVYQASIDEWVSSVEDMLRVVESGMVTQGGCDRFFDANKDGAERRYHAIFVAHGALSSTEKIAARESFNATRERYKDVFKLVNSECSRRGW